MLTECEHCMLPFLPKEGKKYCSGRCKRRESENRRRQRRRNEGKPYRRWLTKRWLPLIASCQHCGSLFKPRASKHAYCSKQCIYAADMAKIDAVREILPQPVGQRKRGNHISGLPCRICGKPILDTRRSAYCSTPCRMESRVIAKRVRGAFYRTLLQACKQLENAT